jgi:phosphoglycolate phosphatase
VRYRLVIFDFDGTLADSFAWFTGALNEAALRHGLAPIAPWEIERARGLEGRELLRHLRVPIWKVPRLAAHMRRAMAAARAPVALFPGVDALLRRLEERGVALAIVSSNSEANVRRILGPENAARVRHLACGAPVLGKARRFRRVVRDSGVPRGEVLCVGDEQRDLHAARAAGLAFGAVSWGFATLEALLALGPDEVFHSVEELAVRLG